jgi:hypothetical protein
VRINQIRAFHIQFDEDEYLVYQVREGIPPGYATKIDISVTGAGAAKIVFSGHYFDFFDLEMDGDGGTRPKRKTFRVEQMASDLTGGPEDPVMQFIGKLNLMRQDEMTLAQFMAEEDPVG